MQKYLIKPTVSTLSDPFYIERGTGIKFLVLVNLRILSWSIFASCDTYAHSSNC
jgi:hypothetical protein